MHRAEESLVEEAIAKAYSAQLAQVQRANMLLGQIRPDPPLAVEGKLPEAKMRMFHPIGFMLASPIDSPEEGLTYFADATVEDKYDGIRAQAHVSNGEVKLFSRTRDEITESFPELSPALAELPEDATPTAKLWPGNFRQIRRKPNRLWTKSFPMLVRKRRRTRPCSPFFHFAAASRTKKSQ